MFERFTDRARHVIVLAQEEARRLRHDYIGTEHLLLGLLREQDGIAARVLDSLGITVEEVRAQVVRIVGQGAGDDAAGQIPLTPRAKKAMELALREALSLGHNYIGTEHILLGLAGEREGVAARILLDFDADPETVGNEVMRALGSPQDRAHEPSPHKPRIVILCCPSCGSGIVETMGTHEPPNSLQAKGEGDLECPNCSTQWTAEWSVRMTRR